MELEEIARIETKALEAEIREAAEWTLTDETKIEEPRTLGFWVDRIYDKVMAYAYTQLQKKSLDATDKIAKAIQIGEKRAKHDQEILSEPEKKYTTLEEELEKKAERKRIMTRIKVYEHYKQECVIGLKKELEKFFDEKKKPIGFDMSTMYKAIEIVRKYLTKEKQE
ncbi:hypothetical protein JXB28_00005 [Candidatus Woesearchaeota archaeon]|nr:hypothetical protein [Candidatus Woesearchaeota archaeon]